MRRRKPSRWGGEGGRRRWRVGFMDPRWASETGSFWPPRRLFPASEGDSHDEPDPARRERRRPPPPLRTTNASSTPSPAPNRGWFPHPRVAPTTAAARSAQPSSTPPAGLSPLQLRPISCSSHPKIAAGKQDISPNGSLQVRVVGIHVPPLPCFGE